MSITSLDYGLELIEGLMGSGKSYFATRRVVQTIQTTRRPVYTNLPLKFPVVRAYLRSRGGPELAGLIRRLDETHWRAFLARQHKFAKFRERLSKKRPADLEPAAFAELVRATGKPADQLRRAAKFYTSDIAAWFEAVEGPHVVDGPDANWIPPASVICIDEVQHWHPMTAQKGDTNRDDLLAYLTMCRHHVHWVWIITQDATRISIEFRRLAHYVWRVWNRAEDRLAWGVRWKHLGVKAMGYRKVASDDMVAGNKDSQRPSESFTILPWLPRNKVIFRLYSSHTNLGNAVHLERELRRARVMAGLSASGVSRTEVGEMLAKRQEERRKPRLMRRVVRAGRNACVVVLCCGVAWAVGRASAPETEVLASEQQASEPGPIVWPRWSSAGRRPIVGARRVEVGDAIDPRAVVEFIHPNGRAMVLRVDDVDWWLWDYPQPEPVRVGPIEDVRSRVAGILAGGAPPAPGSGDGPAGPDQGAVGGGGDGDALGDRDAGVAAAS